MRGPFGMAHVLALCLTQLVHAQDKTDLGRVFYQLNYRPGDWISYSNHRYVTCLALGFRELYVGTTGGVVRVDIHTKDFSSPLTVSDRLLDNHVSCVAFEKRTQLLWVATQSGIHTYDPISQWMTASDMRQSGIGPGETILSIGFDKNAMTTWVHSTRTYYVSTRGLVFEKTEPPSEGSVEWYGQLAQTPYELPPMYVTANSGFTFQASARVFVNRDFLEFPVSCALSDYSGDYWLGTSGAGIWHVETALGKAQWLPFGLYSENVMQILFDGDDMIIGSASSHIHDRLSSGGITTWTSEGRFIYDEPGFSHGLKADNLTSLLIDSSHVWVGTENALYQKQRSSGTWSAIRPGHLGSDVVLALASSAHGTIIVGTRSGPDEVILTDGHMAVTKNRYRELHNTAIYRIRVESQDWWLGTGNGIFHLQTAHDQIRHYDALGFKMGSMQYVDQSVKAIARDDSCLYFVSKAGVAKYDRHLDSWESIPVSTDFLKSGVHDARADARNLWIATDDGVLRYVKHLRKWIYYGEKDGLAGRRVNCIMPDGDYVWFGTSNGLTQFYWNAPHLTD